MKNLVALLLVTANLNHGPSMVEGSTSYLARTPWITKRRQASTARETTTLSPDPLLAGKKRQGFQLPSILNRLRGGDDASSTDVLDDSATAAATTEPAHDEPSLDEKVHAAMRKLGLQVPPSIDEEEEQADDADNNCKDGVCELPSQANAASLTSEPQNQKDDDPNAMVKRLSESLQLESGMVWAALGATSTQNANGSRTYNEAAARELLQVELDMVASIPESSQSVQTLQKEGHSDVFLVRRALAFAEGNLDNARAILIADEEEEEEMAPPPPSPAASFKTVNVDANFDPTQLKPPSTPQEPSLPSPAPKDSVVFEATTAQVFELVLESPVPVLLDIYAGT